MMMECVSNGYCPHRYIKGHWTERHQCDNDDANDGDYDDDKMVMIS